MKQALVLFLQLPLGSAILVGERGQLTESSGPLRGLALDLRLLNRHFVDELFYLVPELLNLSLGFFEFTPRLHAGEVMSFPVGRRHWRGVDRRRGLTLRSRVGPVRMGSVRSVEREGDRALVTRGGCGLGRIAGGASFP